MSTGCPMVCSPRYPVATAARQRHHELSATERVIAALALARALPKTFSGSIITHSMPVVQLFATGPSLAAGLVALGGELRCDHHDFVGPCAEAALEWLRAKTYFLEPT